MNWLWRSWLNHQKSSLMEWIFLELAFTDKCHFVKNTHTHSLFVYLLVSLFLFIDECKWVEVERFDQRERNGEEDVRLSSRARTSQIFTVSTVYLLYCMKISKLENKSYFCLMFFSTAKLKYRKIKMPGMQFWPSI